MMTSALPPGLLLAYYGDDFTGSTDAMEAMTAAGIDTVLFLAPPTPALAARFPTARCVGIAGSSRGRDPAWMRRELPKAFACLAALSPPVLHYKVCSTFDSSPTVGSIGCATELGVQHARADWSPSIVGVPRLRRYQVFGNLFAAVQGIGYRLDRHPTMSRHPVTPMAEADLRVHLREQTARRIDLIDMVALSEGSAATRLNDIRGEDVPTVLIDVLNEETLVAAGRLIWEHRGDGLFSASSSGLSYALTAYWRAQGWVAGDATLPRTMPVCNIAAVSGSCSPVTAGQIAWARGNGFVVERVALDHVFNDDRYAEEIMRLVGVAVSALDAGSSPLIASAEGPADEAVLNFDTLAARAGLTRMDAARRVGQALAAVMQGILDQRPIKRVVIAGGDSSGEVMSMLHIDALTVSAELTPGAPLCRAWSSHPGRDGLELVLKGGQIGTEDFFGLARDGRV